MQQLKSKRFSHQTDVERVVLFGSYTRGEATEHSDVDLLVIPPSDLSRFKRSRALYFYHDAREQKGLCPPRLNLSVCGWLGCTMGESNDY